MLPDWMILGIAFIVIVLAFAFVCRSSDAPARRPKNVNPPPTYARPPAPPGPPPMADTIYGCAEHYYGGCPNCGRGMPRARAAAWWRRKGGA